MPAKLFWGPLGLALLLSIWSAPAQGAEEASSDLKIFEFDYDRQNQAASPPAAERAVASPAKPAKTGVITIVGEPAAPGAPQDDYLPDHKAPEITLSPAGLPPTTRVPAKPGEARVEKTGPSKPPRSAPKAVAAPAAAQEDLPPGSLYRFWRHAQANWARYGGAPYYRPAQGRAVQVVGYTAAGVPIQDLSLFGQR